MIIRFLFSLMILSFPMFSMGQNEDCDFEIDSLTGEKIYTSYDQPPNIGGSEQTTQEYLKNNIEYPHHYKDKEWIVVTFTINRNGQMDQVSLYQNSKNELVNQKVVSAFKNMPNWNPALCNGEPVTAKYVITIRFGLLKDGN